MSVNESKLPFNLTERHIAELAEYDELRQWMPASDMYHRRKLVTALLVRAQRAATGHYCTERNCTHVGSAEQPNSAPELDCVCGDAKAAHQGQMGFGPCIVNCCGCREYRPKQANSRICEQCGKHLAMDSDAYCRGHAERPGAFVQSVGDRFRRILVEQLGIDESELQGNPDINDDLGADSLDSVEIIMACETEFHIDVCDADAEKVKTVNDAVSLIESLMA